MVIAAISNTASAQSNVTLYGIIDDGLLFNSNAGGHRLYAMASGGLSGSRFGLRGSEDLGGGLKTIFVLENGFDPNTGRLGLGGLMFGRQAYMGMSGAQVGTVTAGRQYDSMVDYVGAFQVGTQWGGSLGSHPGDLDNSTNSYRTNNTVKYASPKLNGLSFGGTYSFGGISGDFTQNQIWSLGAGYTAGNLALGIAYLNARTPSNAGGLFGNSTSTTTPAAVTTPIYSGFVSSNTYQVIGAGGSYTVGSATAGATYSNIKFMNLGANGATIFSRGETATFNNSEINFKYQLTPALVLGTAFDYTVRGSVALANGSDIGKARYYQGSVGADYYLSKRTDIYAVGVYQKASGTDSQNRSAVATITQMSPSSTDRQVAVRIGFRHKF
ncbi:porin [Paraburkholderia dipogonis]|uniref:Porin n=2 Tax=Paraburkholderia dipogonis TaxID=1211383 RepID=A0A4Y8MKJ6_9BURK|nr:porin [Paraburkholderia dipogonis]TFE37962.1 porin [Paraburkholderia dipogonis]